MQASSSPSRAGERWNSLFTAGIREAQLPTKKPVEAKIAVSETRIWRLVGTCLRLPVSPPGPAGSRGARAGRRLHLLGRLDPDQVEAASDDRARRLAEAEPEGLGL